jgi:hypothetical protein
MHDDSDAAEDAAADAAARPASSALQLKLDVCTTSLPYSSLHDLFHQRSSLLVGSS